MQALYRNAGRSVTIDQLCEAAWGDNPYGYENSLMAHIRRIREKIEQNPSRPVSLLTVKGLGYKLLTMENGKGQGNCGDRNLKINPPLYRSLVSWHSVYAGAEYAVSSDRFF